MLFLKLVLLAFIAHESMRIINLNDYIRLVEILKELKQVEKGTKKYDDLGIELYTNKHYIVIYIAEFLYTVFAFSLLFTPFYLVGIALITQSLIVHFVKKEEQNVNWLRVDSVISIVIMALGIILIG